jgi:hypothetical protein
MYHSKSFKHVFVAMVLGVFLAAGLTVTAQETAKNEPAAKKSEASKKPVPNGRDPFIPYRVSIAALKRNGTVTPPSIQERIDQYRAQKLAAMNAHLPAPKPTTALLLSEIQVVGISRTPRGYAAIVEATPIKLSYTIYPGERLYDGQLVAIEDTRLVFRHETVWSDGRREKSVELKSLRQQAPIDAMASVKPASVAPVVSDKKPEEKASAPTKP